MERIEMARKIAEAASHMDWIKNSAGIAADDRMEAARHEHNLHRIAEQLAGARAHEIYGQPNQITQTTRRKHAQANAARIPAVD